MKLTTICAAASVIFASPYCLAQSTAISTPSDLYLVSANLAGDFHLTNDIDLSGSVHTPLGDLTTPFTGTFDGNGYTISGVQINECPDPTDFPAIFAFWSADFVGFFGVTDGATIRDLHLQKLWVAGDEFVGALVGQARDTLFERCSAEGSVYGRQQVGGLLGFAGNCDAVNSWTHVNVDVCEASLFFDPGKWQGGFVGHLHPYRFPGLDPSNTGDGSTVTNCYALGDVRGDYVTGGFAGNFHGSVGRDCFATGDVTSINSFTGGFAGYIQVEPGIGATPVPLTTMLTDTHASGTVTSTQFGNYPELQALGLLPEFRPAAGGFIGYCEGGLDGEADPFPIAVITDCAARGDVFNFESNSGFASNTGGFVGFTETDTIITDCVATGDVDAEFASSAGGFIGWSEGLLERCTSLGNVRARDLSGAFGGQIAARRNAITGDIGPYRGITRFCTAYGNMVSTDDRTDTLIGVSAFHGYLFDDVLVEDCQAYGSVTSLGGWVGGFVGHAARDTIRRCASFGPVYTHASNAGGFIGRTRLNSGCFIEDCYSQSDVIFLQGPASGMQTNIGGFIGSAEVGTTVRRCYSSGTVVASGPDVGGFVGDPAFITFAQNYWDTESSHQTGSQPAGVNGQTTAQMFQQATYTGWDFTAIWDIIENIEYPSLR